MRRSAHQPPLRSLTFHKEKESCQESPEGTSGDALGLTPRARLSRALGVRPKARPMRKHLEVPHHDQKSGLLGRRG